ncbi:hypothetical protein [Pseudomonas azotoformans]|uniref:hypothetical protein n=1 Tax=Pseudomonas azotoformans TaxID=47878 RepID=UPI0009771810|nr:hypothetical protein [Pseudomonas azotoformans]
MLNNDSRVANARWSGLASKKREGAACILVTRVIVNDHRWQASPGGNAHASTIRSATRPPRFVFDFDLRRPPKSLSDYGHTEPRRGTECWGKSVLLTFDWAGIPAFQK